MKTKNEIKKKIESFQRELKNTFDEYRQYKIQGQIDILKWVIEK